MNFFGSKRIVKHLKTFLLQPESAMNLGVFRLVLCGYVIHYVNADRILDYSQLPSRLIIPPYGMHAFTEIVPINYDLTVVFLVIFYVFGLASTLGLLTRYSLPLFTVSAFYVLTIPQLFGKVNHYHHFVWFLLILSLSPSGDSLSIDALLDENRSFFETKSSTLHGLPLKFCWLLIGVIYFFPGFWKLWENGTAWIVGNNLRYTLYHKWYEVGATPIFRIDRYPILLKTGAFSTILFEMGFILAIFNPYTLILFLMFGLLFHTSTQIFMFISFTSLLVTYVVFLNWEGLFSERTLPEKLLSWTRLKSHKTITANVSTDSLIPGAVKRVFAAGLFLLAVNVGAGLTQTTSGWPFSCYPTFANSPEPFIWSLQFGIRPQDNEEILTTTEARNRLGVPVDRFRGPIRNLLNEKTFESFEQQARRILKKLEEQGLVLGPNRSVKIYSVKRSVDPDRPKRILKRNPVTTVTVPPK